MSLVGKVADRSPSRPASRPPAMKPGAKPRASANHPMGQSTRRQEKQYPVCSLVDIPLRRESFVARFPTNCGPDHATAAGHDHRYRLPHPQREAMGIIRATPSKIYRIASEIVITGAVQAASPQASRHPPQTKSMGDNSACSGCGGALPTAACRVHNPNRGSDPESVGSGQGLPDQNRAPLTKWRRAP